MGSDRRETEGDGQVSKVIFTLELWKIRGFMLDYLAGLAAGDGSITLDKYGRWRVRIFDASKEFLEALCMLINADMKYNCRIHWDGTVWYLSIYSEELAEALKSRLTNPIDTHEWVKGFVDAEGSIYKWVCRNNKVYYQVAITNTNINYIEIIEKVLKNLEIEYRVAITRDMWKPRYRVLINKRESLRRFLMEVGFRHPLKAERARHIL